jgi:hypothetical protein
MCQGAVVLVPWCEHFLMFWLVISENKMCSKVLCNLLAEVVQVVCSYLQGLAVVLFMNTALIALIVFSCTGVKFYRLIVQPKYFRQFSAIGFEIEKA